MQYMSASYNEGIKAQI